MMKLHCYHGKLLHRKMFVKALVAPAGWWENAAVRDENPHVMPISVIALLDTGANITCIPLELAEALEIRSDNNGWVVTNDGRSSKKIYEVDIRVLLPLSKAEASAMGGVPSRDFYGVPVMETFANKNRIILGMDIITQGELRVKGQNFTLCL